MKIVLTGEFLKNELTTQSVGTGHAYIWVHEAADFVSVPEADVYIDASFNGQFYSNAHKPLLIAETTLTFIEMTGCPNNCARFCNWNGFASRPLWEIAATGNTLWLKETMLALGKGYELVADQPGLVAPRILSMIINEASFALSEGVASPSDIDTAMKLGTNYPAGPVAWGKLIGAQRIYRLLQSLSRQDKRYQPHPHLIENIKA